LIFHFAEKIKKCLQFSSLLLYWLSDGKKQFPIIYWVECPALPGCASQGDTEEGALIMIKDAIEGHLEVVAKRHKKVAQ